jgi:hypothetical protein
LLFPASGKKPMFLWWYTNDTDNIYVVKYKGLIIAGLNNRNIDVFDAVRYDSSVSGSSRER